MAKRQKYKERPDGRRETTKSYKDFGPSHFTGKKHFYGKSDDDIDQKIEDFEESLNAAPASRPLSEVIDDWWEEKEKQLSPNTVQSYKTKKNEISDHFGSCEVFEITSEDIYTWLDSYRAKGYSQHSINDRKSVLKNILDYATAHNKKYSPSGKKFSVNPCSNVPSVKSVKPKAKRRPAAEEDVAKLEAHKTDSLIARLYYFLEYTGCRIGEAVVLQQKDIDRDHHKATISKDLAFDGNDPLVKENPKTEAGIREIDLYDNVLEILPEYKNPETFIFFPDGLPRRSRLQRIQKKFQKDIGISSTAHQLRHTYAGIMHSAEIDVKDTQARLGHANISVTQDIYTEIEKAHNEKVRNKANDFILSQRLGRDKKKCPKCGSTYICFEDGHVCIFCPDCGQKLE